MKKQPEYLKKQPEYLARISQDPQVMVGKPVVKGTRIPVELVIGFLADNPDLDEMFAAYLELTGEDVKAVLAYAKAAVERSPARRRKALVAALAAQSQLLQPSSRGPQGCQLG